MDLFGIGSVVGGILGYKGVRATNQANEDMAHEANVMNQQNAREQMAFQAEQSSTAYQRAVADMEQAGLNPMLAYQQGGASTPGGASGHAVASRNENPMAGLGQGISSAVQLLSTKAQIDNIEATTDRTAADAQLARAMVPSVAAKSRLDVASAAGLEARLKDLFPHEVSFQKYSSAEQQVKAREASERFAIESGRAEGVSDSRWRQEREARSLGLKLHGQEFEQRGKSFAAELRQRVAEAFLSESKMPGAQNDADYERSFWGGRYERFLPDLGSISSSAIGAAAGARLGVGSRDSWANSRPARVGPIEPHLSHEGSGLHRNIKRSGRTR